MVGRVVDLKENKHGYLPPNLLEIMHFQSEHGPSQGWISGLPGPVHGYLLIFTFHGHHGWWNVPIPNAYYYIICIYIYTFRYMCLYLYTYLYLYYIYGIYLYMCIYTCYLHCISYTEYKASTADSSFGMHVI